MKNFYQFAKITISLSVVLAALIFNDNLRAQISVGGLPMSSMIQLNDNLSTVNTPLVDKERLLEEDRAMESVPGMRSDMATTSM